ncbi:hypothetical protein BX600DRAFT_507041 [Xylariales sp. PMI_506]|nr:hypothetical protein BX600DRAFT_507041 [Xylariales sp. PMI_506]
MGGIFYQTYMKWFPVELPPPATFQGQTAVVTGATSGLGLAAAVHLINLGASEVIISSRNSSRAESALGIIERETGGKSKGKVRVLELNMQKYESVKKFADEVNAIKKGSGGVDVVILNAGVVSADFTMDDEGWEQSLHVNTLSTALLAALLFPRMNAERANRPSAAHLSIVGSGQHTAPNISTWASWITDKDEGVLQHLNKPENWAGPDAMYAATKLMVQYVANELAKRALGPDGWYDIPKFFTTLPETHTLA